MANVPLNPTPRVAQMPRVIALGSMPRSMTCSSCGAAIVTYIQFRPTTQTHLIALLVCCFCTLGTFIPYCVDSCQIADHYCPNCDAYLGTNKR